MRTLTGDCTSSEDVAEAWSLSPSDPIFKSSCTISGSEEKRRAGQVGVKKTPSPTVHSLSTPMCAHGPWRSLESFRERVVGPRKAQTDLRTGYTEWEQ